MRKTIVMLSCSLVIGCGTAQVEERELSSTERSALEEDRPPSAPVLLPRSARVGERSQLRWSEDFWRWLLAIPAAQSPELVLSADCGQGQDGPVFYLPGFAADVYTRTCQVPAGRFLFASAWALLNDYPCPDPTFQPAPGQSLEAFLQAGATAFLSGVKNLQVTLDGQPISWEDHRLTSDVFHFTGDPSLTSTFDGCITGRSQQAITDGWWLMFAPLPHGKHTLVVTATAPSGNATAQTFIIEVGERSPHRGPGSNNGP